MNKVLSFLGLTRKSGNLVIGYNKNMEQVKLGKIKLLIVSTGASQNTRDKFKGYGERYNVPYIEDFTPDELGTALGFETIAVVWVSDYSMAKKLKTIYDSVKEENINGGGPIVKNQSV